MAPKPLRNILVSLLSVLPIVLSEPSIPVEYCAKLNTASSAGNHSTWQSEGNCHQNCQGDWAYAVLKYDTCWCSNYTPDDSQVVDLDKCDTTCPGWKDDICGGDGLFAYVFAGGNPSGTKGAPSTPTRTTDPATQTLIRTRTIQNTVTFAPSSPSSLTPSSPTDTIDTTDTTKKSKPTSTEVPETTRPPTFSTVTAGGTVRTVTVQPTSTPGGDNESSSMPIQSGNDGLSTGQAVGVAVGVIAIAIGLIAIGVVMWLRRRNRRQAEDMLDEPSQRGSSSGMVGTPRPELTEVASGGNTPGSWGDSDSAKRRSRLMPIDPRMDIATTLYNRNDNISHDSINTLRDENDYSRKVHQPRVLRATNPDPDN